MNKLLILLYLLIIYITICLGDCGIPGQPVNVHVYNSKEKSKEGDEVIYECNHYYRLIGDNRRKCERGRWTGEVPRCAKYLEQDLTVQKLTFSYVNQEKSYTEEMEIEPQLLSHFNEQDECLELNGSNYIQFNLTFSPSTHISFIELYIFNGNETQRSMRYIPFISAFISQFKNCHPSGGHFNKNEKQVMEFLCDVKEGVNLLEEKLNLPNSISFELKSLHDSSLQLSICQVKLYQIPDICGLPDVPLHATIQYKSERQVSFFSEDPKRYQVLGEDTIHCESDGKWFPSSPIIKPNITCPIEQALLRNTSDYMLEIKDYEYLNGTMVAIANTTLIFKCINENNETSQASNQTSLIEIIGGLEKSVSGAHHEYIQYCSSNGEWKGQTMNCPRRKLNNTDGTQLGIKPIPNTLFITLISLVSLLFLIIIGLSIIVIYLILHKKRKNEVKMRNGNEIYYQDGESVVRRSDENECDTIRYGNNMINMYTMIRDTSYYDQVDVERHEIIAPEYINVNLNGRYD